ncbi:hypothetical protein Hanom_Chr04g00294641 [Helianthus anomalus]
MVVGRVLGIETLKKTVDIRVWIQVKGVNKVGPTHLIIYICFLIFKGRGK